ncbi:hypothetical protein CEP54_003143 [Fusarium duplospermum]|uniref:BZIP domain-containing protein n=1 Tax=Fusarium duplospermum TaxID=1325734 RepID=A0A428QR18_9HYPO|nr:hypothetical protein CEP54_003143 [Fusarium duplospermum]
MSTPAQKANLARIRDNQRRSRARRREYLQELEQRLRVYELQGVEASSEVQQAARRVAEENRQLRGLLNRHGITDDYISSYLHTGGAAAQTEPTPIPHFTSSNPSDAVQSLQHVIAPRRPAPLDPGVSYVVPPQESRETSIASVSTSSSSLWEPGQGIQPGPAYGRPLPSNVPTPIGRQSISSQMHPQQYAAQVFPGTQVPRTETYHPVAAPGPLLEDPRRHSYSVAPMPGDASSTLGYSIPMNPFHSPVGPDTGPSGPC